jgi:hypothetical protein
MKSSFVFDSSSTSQPHLSNARRGSYFSTVSAFASIHLEYKSLVQKHVRNGNVRNAKAQAFEIAKKEMLQSSFTITGLGQWVQNPLIKQDSFEINLPW